jgi:hypothetical protein
MQLLSDLITRFQALNPEQQKWVLIIGAIVAVVGPLLMVIGSLITAFTAIASVVAAITVPMALIAAAIAGVIAYFGMLYLAWTNNFMGIQTKVQELAMMWQTVLLPAIMAVWTWLSTVLWPFFQALGNFFSAVFSLALRALAGVWQNVLLPVLMIVYNALAGNLMPIFEELADFWQGTLLPIIQNVAQWIGGSLSGAFNTLTSTLQSVTSWLGKVASMLDNLSLPSWMTPGSPTPWEIGLLGVNDALKQVSGIGLPSLSANMGGISAPAIAGGGGMALSGGGNGMAMQFVYQPFIGVNDEYEAEQKLRGIVERISRRGSNQ